MVYVSLARVSHELDTKTHISISMILKVRTVDSLHNNSENIIYNRETMKLD